MEEQKPSQELDHHIVEQYENRRDRRIFVIGLLVVVGLAFTLLSSFAPGFFPGWVSAFVWIAIVGGLVWTERSWRCPSCDKYLGWGINPKFCPHCGIRLDE
jgi:hypothetical protein